MSSSKFSGDSLEEISSRLTAASFNLKQAKDVSLSFKKLHSAMGSIAVANPKRQLALIKSSLAYIDSDIVPKLNSKLTREVRVLRNELTSLHEGVRANAVKQEDMFLTSGLDAVRAAERLIASITKDIDQLKAGTVYAHPGEAPQSILQRNAKYKSKLPDLSKKDYGVARVPVTFSLMPSKGPHSKVGYLDTDMLSHLGFKATLLEGYAIIENQVVIGISRSMLIEDYKEVELGDGSISKEAIPKMVKERVTKFTKSKPGIAVRRRPKTVLDAAQEVKTMLENHTNCQYAIVSEKSHGYQGNSYFWLMPSKDLTRFSRAFPGGHIHMNTWGFAF